MATFDCYGTLVDWNGGIREELEKLFGAERADELLVRHHELEPRIQAARPGSSYREGLDHCSRTPCFRDGAHPARRRRELAGALAAVLAGVRGRSSGARGGQKPRLATCDPLQHGPGSHRCFEKAGRFVRDGHRRRRDRFVQAAHKHWEVFYEQTGADPAAHVHVAQSLYHDIVPAAELGIPSIWINRLDEPADPRPSRTLPGVASLPDALDDLVPRA